LDNDQIRILVADDHLHRVAQLYHVRTADGPLRP
jgi:hypothetical protein